MPLIGNTKAYDLSSVFQFLSDNRYTGSLSFHSEKGGEEVFYLVEGNLKVPYDGEGRPIFDEGRSLEAPPVFPQMDEEERGRFLAEVRTRAEEAVYERFLWEAKYRFDRDVIPVQIRTGEYPTVTLPTGSIIMEGARRIDDINLQREKVPEDVLLEFCGEVLEGDNRALIELMDGSRNIEGILEESGGYVYPVFMEVVRFVEEGRCRHVTKDQYLEKMLEFIEVGRVGSAFRMYQYILDFHDPEKREQAGEILFSNVEIWQEKESYRSFCGVIKGEAFTYLLKETVRNGVRIAYRLRDRETGHELILVCREDCLEIFEPGVDHAVTTLSTLRQKGYLSDQVVAGLMARAPFTLEDISRVVVGGGVELPVSWETFCVNRVVDLIAPIYNQVLELRSGLVEDCVFSEGGVPFVCPLDRAEVREMLRMMLDQWISVRDDAPQDLAIYTCSKKAKEAIRQEVQDPLIEFLKMFYRNRKPLGKLYQSVKDTISASEFFFKTVAHIAADNLRPLLPENLKQLVKSAIMEEDYDRALEVIKSAQSMGYEDPYFSIMREDIRLRMKTTEEGDRLVGDLQSFSLAEVLQNLVNNQMTGTLRISSPHADQEIYFYRGEVSVLRREESEEDDFFKDVMGETEDQDWSWGGEELDEEQLRMELATHIQEEIYEIFLWDGAEFTFILDALPPEFFDEDAQGVQKVALNTMSFLMGAVGRLEEWAEISRVITSEKAIFKFVLPEYKEQAMAAGEDTHLLYLIDGAHNVEDLIRISGRGKFEVCSMLYDYYEAGYIAPLDINELIQRGKEAYDRKDYESSRKFYSFAVIINPNDHRIRKIVEGLTRRLQRQQR